MKYLNNWFIVELTKHIAIGVGEDGLNVFTDGIMAICGDYLVTERKIYKLGKPDSLWISTSSGRENYEKFYSKP